MTIYSYKVVPAPAKARKRQGVKAPEALFALAVEETINDMARDGWEYLRADALPSQERSGLISTRTVQRSVLVFRRALSAADTPAPQEAATPQPGAYPTDASQQGSYHPAPPARTTASHPYEAPAVQRPEPPRAAPQPDAPLRRTPPLSAQLPEREARWQQPEEPPEQTAHDDEGAPTPPRSYS